MENKTCFILMPFTKTPELSKDDLDYIYNHIIKKVVSEYEFENTKYFNLIQRFDGKVGSIINGIIKNLSEADLVIADLTALNPNVMYELGVRHSLKRGTIIISQDLNNLPSDLRDYLTVGYKYSDNTIEQQSNLEIFRVSLYNAISEILSTDKFDSPVLNYFNQKIRFRKEDEIEVFKSNFIIIDLIFQEYYEIEDMIKALLEGNFKNIDSDTMYQLFKIKLNNLIIALNELNITHTSSILFEQITNSKTILQDISQSFSMSQYFNSIENDEVRSVISKNPDVKACVYSTIVDIFSLVDGKPLKYINMTNLFSKDGILQIELLDFLEEYLDKKSKELGIDEDEISNLLVT